MVARAARACQVQHRSVSHPPRRGHSMRTRITVVTAGIAAALLTVAASRPGTPSIVHSGVGAKLQSISALAIGPNGVLYAADPQAATIYALDLSKLASATPGTKDVADIDQKIASVLGTAA